MKEVLENYQKAKDEFEEKKRVLDEEFEALLKKTTDMEKKMKEKLERAKARTDKAYNKITELCRNESPSIHRNIIIPLAEKLSAHFGMQYEIYGPFGTECETSIYLRKDMAESICDQPTISIVLRPEFEEKWVYYNTGEKHMRYPKGSVGDLNGLNDVYAPLPMEFDKILELVKNDFEGGVSE